MRRWRDIKLEVYPLKYNHSKFYISTDDHFIHCASNITVHLYRCASLLPCLSIAVPLYRHASPSLCLFTAVFLSMRLSCSASFFPCLFYAVPLPCCASVPFLPRCCSIRAAFITLINPVWPRIQCGQEKP